MPRTATRPKAEPRTQPAQLPATGYVRIAQLIPGVLPFSQATLWRMVKRKTFPAPVKLSENITAWDVVKVRAWLESRAEGQAA